MTMRAGILVTTLVLIAGMQGGSAMAADIPWKRIPDARNLTQEQRDFVAHTMSSAVCYGGCAGTILDCVNRNDPIGIRLANFLARRAAAGANYDKLMAAVDKRRLSAFPPDTMHVDLGSMLPSGNANAPVQVVIYADFDCPTCQAAATALRKESLSGAGTFALWFKNYPLAQDDRALVAARAYLAAEKQGHGWEMFDGLMAHTGDLTDDAIDNIADAAGVDLVQFHTDLKSPELLARVRAQKAEAQKCGFDHVPGILVNGKPYLGPKTAGEILDRIAEEHDLAAVHTASK
ncbi:MAG TPA: thioredoxin domain-containing protein [Candidatus Krumholzibacteria bacterium]|nr:thioredoxin domain-containing protein [Candidatus Krumholzibacteria bacterium]